MATHRSGYFKVSYANDMALFDTPWRVFFWPRWRRRPSPSR